MKLILAFVITVCAIGQPAYAYRAEFTLDECKDGAGGEACYWRLYFNGLKCSQKKPCSKLIVFFSGGDMGCDAPITSLSAKGYRTVENTYANDDYLFVCAGTMISESEAGKSAYHKSAPRIYKLMKSIVTSDEVMKRWTGEHLLLSGASQGASAPVIAMARHQGDNPVNWPGIKYAAACFYDGSYNAKALDAFLIQNINNSHCAAFRHRAICNRYTEGKSKTECELNKATIKPTTDMELDTITELPASNYSIQDWKLIECGSELETKCGAFGLGDMLPKESIKALCDTLNGDPNHHCDWDPLPKEHHIGCASKKEEYIDKCRLWFNDKIPE